MSTTGATIAENALKTIGVLAQGQTANPNDAAEAFARLNRLVDFLGTQRLTIYATAETTVALAALTQSYTIGAGATWNLARPLWIPYADLLVTQSTPNFRIPLDILTLKDWTRISIKSQQSTYPTKLYYDYGFDSSGYGTVQVWPIPTQVNSIVLFTPTALTQFATPTTAYSFPPGYELMLESNLARWLCAPFGRALSGDVAQMAEDTLAAIKRANTRLTDLSIDHALRPRGAYGNYNWRTDENG